MEISTNCIFVVKKFKCNDQLAPGGGGGGVVGFVVGVVAVVVGVVDVVVGAVVGISAFALHLEGLENIAFFFASYISTQEATLPTPALHFLDSFCISWLE